jgi:hypothetical protein
MGLPDARLGNLTGLVSRLSLRSQLTAVYTMAPIERPARLP